MSKRVAWFTVTFSSLLVFIYAVQRDIGAEKHYTGDLRNRIVGARLIHDGRSPYFYKWSPADGFRYYDPANFDSLRASNITSTPFLHHLLAPLAALPEAQASRLWLLIEYILFLGITALALSLTHTDRQRWSILIVSSLFLLTHAWAAHIALGQVYILLPFLAMLLFQCLQTKRTITYALAAGTIAASLVLVKPNGLFFFIPFLFLARNFPRSWLLAFFVPAALLASWILLGHQEFSLWQDYRHGITEQVRLHQQLDPALQTNTPDPHFMQWEGIDEHAIQELDSQHPVTLYSENGNVFVIVEKLFHRRLSITKLGVLSACLILLLTALYWRRVRIAPGGQVQPIATASQSPRIAPAGRHDLSQQAALADAAILGFCLYMITDLFSPVYRHQYYTIQWIFPVLLVAVFYRSNRKWPFLLILTGLFLNIVHFDFLKMGNTLGEYLLLAALLAYSLLPARDPE